MGNNNSQIDFQYMKPVSVKVEGQSCIYRHPDALEDLQWQPVLGMNNLQDLVKFGYKTNQGREFLGTKDSSTNTYMYKSYDYAFQTALAIGSALQNLSLIKPVQEYKDFNLKFIGILSKNREEWALCDMANALYGFTMIPLYDTLTSAAVSYVLQNSNIKSLYISGSSIETLLKVTNIYSLKNVILFDKIDETKKDLLEQKNLKIYYLQDLIEEGNKNILELPTNIQPDDVFSLCYTSGTTGNPKGAMITHRNILACISNQQRSAFKFHQTDTHLSYLPLPHIFERFASITCWMTGCRIAFYSGDVLKLRDDLQAAKPTVFISVPRLYNKFYDLIMSQLNQLKGIKKIIAQQAISSKLYYLENNKTFHYKLYDTLVFNRIKQIFGGNIRICATGSAPLSSKVIQFFRIALGCQLLQGYGQTEGTGLQTVQVSSDNTADNVGGILESLELKLQDVPEMGYFSTDINEKKQNIPRGEICVRGFSVFKGYYKEEEKTKECLDEDGWLHSGDIGVILTNGAIKIIDRRKNIFKLSQGEYVAPEKVENIYLSCRGVAEVYLHGDSLYHYAVAIIIPNGDELKKIAQEMEISEQSVDELCKNTQIIEKYQRNLLEHGKKEGLHTFEQALKIFLEPVSLMNHGCLTSSFKLQRHIAKNVFGKVIEKLYS